MRMKMIVGMIHLQQLIYINSIMENYIDSIMEKCNFLSLKAELKERLKQLEEEYIRTNSPLEVGTKVKVVTPIPHTTKQLEEYGIILGYKCEYDNVVPVVAKMKKDGTPSKNGCVWIRHNSTIEVC